MATEAPITFKETLELLRAVKPEQLHHYTSLVSQAIRDGELAFQDRNGHSIQIESRPRSTFNDNGRKFAWTFEGVVDGWDMEDLADSIERSRESIRIEEKNIEWINNFIEGKPQETDWLEFVNIKE